VLTYRAVCIHYSVAASKILHVVDLRSHFSTFNAYDGIAVDYSRSQVYSCDEKGTVDTGTEGSRLKVAAFY